MFFKTAVAVVAMQCSFYLLTSSVPRSELASLNAVTLAVASTTRGIGYFFSGLLFSTGLAFRYLILPWWILALIALATAVMSFALKRSERIHT